MTRNPKNSGNKCFQSAMTVKLNHENIGKDPQQQILNPSQIFPAEVKDCKKFETNNKPIALNVLFSTKKYRRNNTSVYLKTQFRS